VVTPPPARYTDERGDTWSVWDLLDGRRVAPGVHQVGQRLLVRDRDAWGFIAGVNPHAPCWPTDPRTLDWNLRRA
jgi:hypothetical protein